VVANRLERPDHREPYERERFLTKAVLTKLQDLTGDKELKEQDPNPFYRPESASEFYQQTLTACWSEAARLLKPGGLMAFTFHHSADALWVDVLEALFNANFPLIATYPVRGDETKGATGAYGSRKIEYDIIHVRRKRLEEPKPESWARMRRWVKDEAARLKELLEHSRGQDDLPESDLLVILRGKSLELYIRHYGQILTGDGKILRVREAILGINALLEDLLIEKGKSAQPQILRGAGISPDDFEARGWVRVVGGSARVVPIQERFQFFTAPGRNRLNLVTDLDQAHFLIGAATPWSGVNVLDELNRNSFHIKKSVDSILNWLAETHPNNKEREAAKLALNIVSHWRIKLDKVTALKRKTFFARLEGEVERGELC
jgi:hypothetical protein